MSGTEFEPPRRPKLLRAFLIGLILVGLAALFVYFFFADPGTDVAKGAMLGIGSKRVARFRQATDRFELRCVFKCVRCR